MPDATTAFRRFSDEIAPRFRPEKIIPFGSDTYGKPTANSGVDLLGVMPGKGCTLDEALEIPRAVEARLPLDLRLLPSRGAVFEHRHPSAQREPRPTTLGCGSAAGGSTTCISDEVRHYIPPCWPRWCPLQ